ncbi:ABC transporter ATP-binding protein [Dethiosulfovibrio sp. F2B]|uniref:ABC transporter ATP-binding protein n=1 Tax=Dethiosulfovibrio faecalis TaxID=2720018 RepID=UPI001F349713|nr:ABC transporter ATP-binding protein [Dethiosulfovibrio faecalis]
MTWLDASFRHSVGDFDLDVDISMEKEISVLFGPSGAGKSMTLRLLAGLIKPNGGGRLILGDRVLSDGNSWASPKTRKISMVFQDLALFPHMTAQRNVAFAMDDRMPRKEANKKAGRWLEKVGLNGKENLFPPQLSGGQRQRVALARSLASDPDLILLDEPFSALDTPLRRSLRRELKRLHRETSVPMIYVTHQIEDVCSLGDRIFLVKDGRITGKIRSKELLSGTGERWHSLGWGTTIEGTVVRGDGGMRFLWNGGKLMLPPSINEEGPASAFINPDNISLLYPGIPMDPIFSGNLVRGTVLERYIIGNVCHLHVDGGGTNWQLEFPSTSYTSLDTEEGSSVEMAVRPRNISIIFKNRRNLP